MNTKIINLLFSIFIAFLVFLLITGCTGKKETSDNMNANSTNNNINNNKLANGNSLINIDTVVVPMGVCSKEIHIKIENNIIKKIKFVKGCQGNTAGLAKLAEGMQVDSVIQKLDGILCGDKTTSCPDQLAKALKSLTNR